MARRILHQGLVRTFRVYLPPDWLEIPDLPVSDYPFVRPALPLPVVLYFHGGNSSIERSIDKADFYLIPTKAGAPGVPVADEDKFISIYVQGLGFGADSLPTYETENEGAGGSWNNGGPTGHLGEEATIHRADDAGLVQAILKLVQAELTTTFVEEREAAGRYPEADRVLDPERVFITGFSGGAGLVYRLAAEPASDPTMAPHYRFRAMAPVAGSAGGFRHHGDRDEPRLETRWDPSLHGGEALHVMAVHGTQDNNVAAQFFKAESPGGFGNEIYFYGHPIHLGLYLLPDEMLLGWTDRPAPGTPYAISPPDGDASYLSHLIFSTLRRIDPETSELLDGLGYADAEAKDLARWDLYVDRSVNLWTSYLGMPEMEPDLVEVAERDPEGSLNFNYRGGTSRSFLYSNPPVGISPSLGTKVVRVLLVDGLGHRWPKPGDPERSTTDATQDIWAFFKEVSFL